MQLKLLPLGLAISLLCPSVFAQNQAPNEFQLTRITRNLITSPVFNFSGAEDFPLADNPGRWVEIEAEFASVPELTEELTFKYFVLFNGKLFAGEVTHIDIPAGRQNRSVMYMTPQTVTRYMGNRLLNPNAVQNAAVQIWQKGSLKSELSLNRAPARWYAALPAITGFLLNKNETPFAPLYWERYPRIKSGTR